MTRRRRKKPLIPSVWIDWSAERAEAFFAPLDKLLTDHQPPARIRVWRGRTHATVVAVYTSPTRGKTTLKARVAL